jgi:hypothetical protein
MKTTILFILALSALTGSTSPDVAQSHTTFKIVTLPTVAQFQLPAGFTPHIQGRVDEIWGPSFLLAYRPPIHEKGEVDQFNIYSIPISGSQQVFHQIKQLRSELAPFGIKSPAASAHYSFGGINCNSYLYDIPLAAHTTFVDYQLYVVHDHNLILIDVTAWGDRAGTKVAEAAAKTTVQQINRTWRWLHDSA